jgi:hypothetical protein
VYEYDARTRTLLRVSIGQEGFNQDGNTGTGEATIVQPKRTLKAGEVGAVRGDPTMSHDGRYVFFESPNALAPGALNDARTGGEEKGVPFLAENIYEWESDGTGSCTQATGCVSLLSDGKDVSEKTATGGSVELLGSDGSGNNVFFQTNDQLVPEDTDTQRDFYDAHICNTSTEATEPCHQPPPPPAPPCRQEACQGSPGVSTVFGVPGGTATFSGPGNLAPPSASLPAVTPKPIQKPVKCKKGFTKRKNKCIKNKKKTKAKKSAHINRRAK